MTAPDGWEWDDGKAEANLAVHGVSFADAVGMDFSTALEFEDRRYDYGETRWRVLGKIGGRLHMMIFTWRDDRRRVISLRKANRREERFHDEYDPTPDAP
ncbi:BrnT family toxin [Jannaschia sp. Os4]|uniref:BrnT family toxin n=1 Tax=Jannaschia sp. Os4 TaxID=2807617 RepID=UPI00193A6E0E|nr:BrnT family toxin [Jannaschia sp. Os4]